MQVQVEIPELKAFTKAMREYQSIAEPIMQKAVEAAAYEVQKKAVRGTVPWRTGFLTQSFGFRPLVGRLFAAVGPTANYALFVHEGTAPHIIRPNTAKALFWPGAPHPMKSVRHPGTKPNRFLTRMVEQAKSAAEGHFKTALDRITGEIAQKTR
jgi:hypothetical protein